MDTPELLIIRHGETEWNREGIMQGHLDSPLTGRVRQQARDVATLLARLGLGPKFRAWVSPLERAQVTARLALAGHFDDWTTEDRLAEVSVGQAQGLTFQAMLRAYPQLAEYPGRFGWQWQVPGG